VVQSSNSAPIQDALEFLVFSISVYDFLNYLDCVSRCHSRMPPIFSVQAVNHFAGLAGDASVGGEAGLCHGRDGNRLEGNNA